VRQNECVKCGRLKSRLKTPSDVKSWYIIRDLYHKIVESILSSTTVKSVSTPIHDEGAVEMPPPH
jgi:hypothetical protein